MSANIYWEPVNPTSARDVDTHTPSNTIECLTKAFGPLPVVLKCSDKAILKGLEIAGIQGIGDLISAIDEHNTIRVWSEA